MFSLTFKSAFSTLTNIQKIVTKITPYLMPFSASHLSSPSPTSLPQQHQSYLAHMTSPDAAVLRRLFSSAKFWQRTNNLASIRSPFLELICQPSSHFRFKEVKLDESPAVAYHVDAKVPSNLAVMYVHGGGFVSGGFPAYKAFCEKLSNTLGCEIFFPEYRLAPEHLVTDSVQDITACYNHIISRGFKKIALMGESAGGTLSLLFLQKLLSSTSPLAKPVVPVCSVLFSPITDLSSSGQSYIKNARKDPVFTADMVKWVLKLARGNQDLHDVSPMHQEVPPDFPPLMIFVDDDEILYDDSKGFVEKVKASKLKGDVILVEEPQQQQQNQAEEMVRLEVRHGLFHAWPLFWSFLKDGEKTISEVEIYLRKFRHSAPVMRSNGVSV